MLAKDQLLANPCVANCNEDFCSGCLACEKVCPYGAISSSYKVVSLHGIKERRLLAKVNETLCQGCGACTVACPSGAMDLRGFSNRQIMAEVDAICQ